MVRIVRSSSGHSEALLKYRQEPYQYLKATECGWLLSLVRPKDVMVQLHHLLAGTEVIWRANSRYCTWYCNNVSNDLLPLVRPTNETLDSAAIACPRKRFPSRLR